MKFQEIKNQYKKSQLSHKETKINFKNKQREYSKGILSGGDLEKKDLRYPYNELSQMETSCYSIRIYHVAYSLLKGTHRKAIEKEIERSIDGAVETKLMELMDLLDTKLEVIKDDEGSILQVKRETGNEG